MLSWQDLTTSTGRSFNRNGWWYADPPFPVTFSVRWNEKGYDIVYGYYPDKKHSAFRNFGSYLNYLTVRILIGKPKDMKTSSYWVIRKFVRDYVIQYQSPYTHLQGLFLRTTRNISCVPIKHFEREVGQSGYTLKKLIQLYSNIMGYSVGPTAPGPLTADTSSLY